MKPPTTREEWWANLDTAWPDILELFTKVGAPLTDTVWNEYNGEGELEEVIHGHTLLNELERAKAERDHETMGKWLQRCWDAAPDQPYIHQWKHWGTLCDLCSENWVFDPDAPLNFRKAGDE